MVAILTIHKGYIKPLILSVGRGTLRALRDIHYGYIDCFEAAEEWRDILAVHLDEPGDFEFFKILRLDAFWQCLGVPGELPDYPAPWDAYLERLECGERYKSLFVGSE